MGYHQYIKKTEAQIASNKFTGTQGPIRASGHIAITNRFDYQPGIFIFEKLTNQRFVKIIKKLVIVLLEILVNLFMIVLIINLVGKLQIFLLIHNGQERDWQKEQEEKRKRRERGEGKLKIKREMIYRF